MTKKTDLAKEVGCECGEATGVACAWHGLMVQTVVIEWMPEDLRDTHVAANNHGRYPYNGAVRLRVAQSCAILLFEADGEWCSEVQS